MSQNDQGAAAVGCGAVLVIAAAAVWFLWSMFSTDDGLDAINAKHRDWPANVLSAARTFSPLGEGDPAKMTDNELAARLGACRELIRVAARDEFLAGVQFPDKNWDGSLGAASSLVAGRKMATPQERVASFRSGETFEEQWLIFGVIDSFSGTMQSIQTGECTSVGDSVWVDVCAGDRGTFCNRKVIAVD